MCSTAKEKYNNNKQDSINTQKAYQTVFKWAGLIVTDNSYQS